MLRFDQCPDPQRTLRDILCGNFTANSDLSKLKPPSYKLHIYISSTFSDVISEHRTLMGKILPSLQLLGRRHGIDLVVIDNYVNFKDEDKDSLYAWKTMALEIDRCRKCSNGLFFLSLLSHKYGHCPLPHLIDARNFEEWMSSQLEEELHPVVLHWYCRSEEFEPPKYILRRVSADESNSSLKTLYTVQARIPDLSFNRAVSALRAQHSVLEWQTLYALRSTMENGTVEEPGLRCHWIHRTFRGGVHKVEDEEGLFTDVFTDDLMIKLVGLKDLLTRTLGPLNRIKEYNSLTWLSYVNPMDGELDKYLVTWETDTKKMLSAQLQAAITQKRSWETGNNVYNVKGAILDELLHHVHVAAEYNSKFIGREELIGKCMPFLTARTRQGSGNGLDGVFMCLTGQPGCGKSAVMARLGHLIFETDRGKVKPSEARSVIIRFCGTTPESSTGFGLVRSLCQQIHLIYSLPDVSISPKYTEAVEYFHTLMAKYKIVLLLDAVETLSDEHLARSNLSFLQGIKPHPEGRVIVSSLPEELDLVTGQWKNFYGCITRLEMSNVPRLELLPYSITNKVGTQWEAQVLLTMLLTSKNLRLASSDFDSLVHTIAEDPSPLYILLTACVIEKWIYGQWSRVLVPQTANLFGMILDNAERDCGVVFTSSALSFISFAVEGLTHNELMDALSLSEDVMSSPGMRQNIKGRVPTWHWVGLRHLLDGLLKESSDGRIEWAHRRLRDLACVRYSQRDDNLPLKTHTILAQYFGNIVEPRTKQLHGISSQLLILTEEACDLTDDRAGSGLLPADTVAPVINRRRVISAGYHMIVANMLTEAEAEMCNPQYVWACLKIGEGHRLLEQLVQLGDAMVREKGSSGTVDYQCRWLRLNMSTVQANPSLLNNPDMSTITIEDSTDISLWIRGINMGTDAGYRALLGKLAAHTHFVRCVAWSPDSRLIASCSNDKTVRIWNPRLGSLVAVLEGHRGWVSDVKWSPTGDRVASASGDNTVRIWEPVTGSLLSVFSQHTDWVRSLAWNNDGTKLASGSGDSTVKIWNSTTLEVENVLTQMNGWVWCVAWQHTSANMIASGGGDGAIRLWSAANGQGVCVLKGHRSCVTCLVWSPRVNILASASNDKTIYIWDTLDRTARHVLTAHVDVVSWISFNDSGSMLVSASNDNYIRMWSMVKAVKVSKLLGHDNQQVTCVAWSPNGKEIASCGYDARICLWDPVLLSSNNASKNVGQSVEPERAKSRRSSQRI